MAERKSVSAEDTIRLSRVVCSVRCHPRKTSLCATLKQVKTLPTVCSVWSIGQGHHVHSFFCGCSMLACVYSWGFCIAVVTSCDPATEQLVMTINSGDLANIKAFRQRADIDSVRDHVLGKYSSSLICSTKDVFWEGCSEDLGRLKLEKKTRRSSSTSSQELADLDDIAT